MYVLFCFHFNITISVRLSREKGRDRKTESEGKRNTKSFTILLLKRFIEISLVGLKNEHTYKQINRRREILERYEGK